ncbi:type II secretion system protein [Peptoniphilus equinus]|uniref:Type II secretion system protein n=1 Tax=Peptoniphilus equinus TaxID=3016343 RepID=A0ABY7QUW4_9FIRM|nr:type II secretion system protein [Peptoniphilus equinus]WBW50567.1 type II secretion system protein [Peptoniphilus equinus]
MTIKPYKGFTLIELIIAIGLLTVVGSVLLHGFEAATASQKDIGAVYNTYNTLENALEAASYAVLHHTAPQSYDGIVVTTQTDGNLVTITVKEDTYELKKIINTSLYAH